MGKRKRTALVFGLAAIAIFAIAYSSGWRSSPWIEARSIRLGDSKETVEHRLGRPAAQMLGTTLWHTNAVAALFSDTAETWVYGHRFDLKNAFHSEFPYFWPLKARFLVPNQDDVAIEFTTAGKVTRITIPPEQP